MLDDSLRCPTCGSRHIEFFGSKRCKDTLLSNTYSAHDVTSIVGLSCEECFEPLMPDITLDDFLQVINSNETIMQLLVNHLTTQEVHDDV